MPNTLRKVQRVWFFIILRNGKTGIPLLQMRMKPFALFIWALFMNGFAMANPDSLFREAKGAYYSILWTDTDSASALLEKMGSLAEESGSEKLQADYLNARGGWFFARADFPEAISQYSAAYDIMLRLGDKHSAAICLNNIAGCHTELDNQEKSIDYYSAALRIMQEENDALWIANINYNLGTANYMLLRYPESIRLFQAARSAFEQLRDTLNIAYTYNSEADAVRDNGDPRGSIPLYQKAEKLLLPFHEEYSLGLCYANWGKSLLMTGQSGRALEIMKRGLPFIDEEAYPKVSLTAYDYLGEAHLANGDADKAIYYKDAARTLYQKIYDDQKQQSFSRAEAIFNTRLKEQEIALNKKIIHSREQALKLVAVLAAILLIILFLLLYSFRALRNANRRLTVLVQEKEMLVKEIHHRVKNNLQVISSLLNMHVRKVEDPGSKRIFDEGISRIQAMSLIHQTIYQQENLQQLQPKAYIERLVQQLYQTYQVSEKQIQVRTDIADVELDIEKLMALGLILNEILSNAFKYAFEGKQEGTVRVSLQKLSTHRLELRVKDDGVGMSLTEADARQEDSLGLKLVRAFSRKLGGELRINSESGTEYQIAFDSGV